jgi:hypothetical protein
VKSTTLSVMCLGLWACAGESAESEIQRTIEPPATNCSEWAQIYGTPQHTGKACPPIAGGLRVAAAVVADTGAAQLNTDFGFYQVNVGSPLTRGSYVYVAGKTGYTGPDTPESQTWTVQALRWQAERLVPLWKIATDWKPVDAIGGAFVYTNGYEQMFQPVLAGSGLYVPAANGKVMRLDPATGAVQAIVNPFASSAFDGDPLLLVRSALSVSPSGKVFYTATALASDLRRASTPRGGWLVEVSQDGTSRIVSWGEIALSSMGVKTLGDLCDYPFGTSGTPAPTGPDSKAPKLACGVATPKTNAAVAFTRTGNPLVWSANNNSISTENLIEVSASTLAPLHVADLTGHLLTGCGVRQTIRPGNRCDLITTHGTVNIGNVSDMNLPMTLRASDIESSAPAVAPDGSWIAAGYDGGFTFDGQFDARGSGLRFFPDGSFASKNESFGWNTTVGVWQRPDGTWSFIQDDQHYSDLLFRVARYDVNFVSEQFAIVDPNFDAVAVDMLDAQPAFDTTGAVYVVNGDGHVRRFSAAGVLLDEIELPSVDSSDVDGVNDMETNIDQSAWGQDATGASVLYISHGGVVYAIGGTGTVRNASISAAPRSKTPKTNARITALAKGFTANFQGPPTD